MGVITVIDQGIVSATSFFTGVIIGRTLEKEQFGYYLLGLTIVFVAINLQNALISWPYTIYINRYNKIQHAIFKGSTLIHLLFLCLILIIVLVIFPIIATVYFKISQIEHILWALVISITFIMLREFIRRIFFASMHMGSALLLDLLISMFQIGGLILFSYEKTLSASRSFWIIGAACGLVSVSWLMLNQESFVFSLAAAWSSFKTNFSFGKWIFIGSTIFTASNQLFPWLLTNYHGVATTGTLAANLGIVGLSNPFAQAIGNYLLPKTTDIYNLTGLKGLRQVVLKATIVIGFIMMIFCLLIFIFGSKFIIFVYGDKYASSPTVLLLLTFSAFASVISSPFSYALYALNKPRILFQIDIASSIIFVLFAIMFIKRLGLLGVGIGLLGGNIGVYVIRYYFYIKSINLSIIKNKSDEINNVTK